MFRLDSTILKTPEEIRGMVDLDGERTFVWQIVRGNGQKAWLRTFDDPMNPLPGEAEISAALKRMTMTLPEVGFVSGNGMRSMTDYSRRGYSTLADRKDFRHALTNQGFDIREVRLRHGIPPGVNILAIADVREPFTDDEKRVLSEYAAGGGNFLVLGEPRFRDGINPLLGELFGVELTPGTLVQYRQSWLQPDILRSFVTPDAEASSFFFRRGASAMMPTAAGIARVADRGFSMFPILTTDTLAVELGESRESRSYAVWNELESLDYADEDMVFNPAAGEVATDYTPGVALTRMVGGKEQRVVILGDVDCLSNGELSQNRSQGNFALNLGVFHFLSGNEMPMDVRRPDPTDDHVNISRAGFRFVRWGFLYLLPLLFAAAGTVIWLRRRSR